MSQQQQSEERNVRRRITVSCASCGSTTHRRSTHRDCPMNVRIQLDAEPHGQPQSHIPEECCPHCGSTSHRRSTHRDCLNNARNANTHVFPSISPRISSSLEGPSSSTLPDTPTIEGENLLHFDSPQMHLC
ncbi:hypothetical protein [Absidia glauca]|uniref:Uncharacterized protein n=1 Tax=Absidia glauca TaxID=4829 RepID=A0A163J361_ABSGL|nr:hypothetical protein [Absidia glauca]